ncbi:MAG: MarR family winged helix-turn-helix transcriptional regulator [Promethearchaeota archaeon]|jgi:DNA-binding MarR family transcriptional regulator
METITTNQTAEHLANLTFSLLQRCQEKEAWLAEEHGLFQAEFGCLRLIGSDESPNNKEIAKRMNLSPSRITRIIDGLVQKGYMIREIDKTDRRNMRVFLSRRGKRLTHKLDKAFVDIHYEILQDIDISQHESLITAMEHLNSAIEKWLQKPD